MLLRIPAAAAAGVALALAFEPVAAAWLVPFAVAGFVLSTRGLRARSGWLPGLAFGLGFYLVHIRWMTTVGPDAWIALSVAVACFYAVLGSLAAVLQGRRGWPVWVAAAWVSVEAWRSSWPFSGMPWGKLAFATVDTPIALSLPYVGMTGVGFGLALLGCVLAWIVTARGGTERIGAVCALLGVVALLTVPTLRPWGFEAEGVSTVAAVQGDVPGPGNDILYDHRQVTRNHVEATIDLGARVEAGTVLEPDFVVWPENSTAVDPFLDAETNAGIEEAVEAVGVPVLVGALVDAGEEHVLNQGIVWDPVTGDGDRYTKWHPVAYGEYIPFRRFFDDRNFGRLALIPRDMLAGDRREPLSIAGVAVADAICFDVAYDDGIHAQVSRGAELLVVQTSNATFIFTDQIDQQFAISRLRAMETGRFTVVAATNGITGVIAPDGSVRSSAGPRTQDVLVEQVGLSTQVTPAVRLGPWPERVAIGLAASGLLLGLVPYRRRRQESRTEPLQPEPVVAGSPGGDGE